MSASMFTYQTPVGPAVIEEDGCGNITALYLTGKGESHADERETETLKEAGRQLNEYFNGTRREFDLELKPKGTEFQVRVWKALARIPYGETRTYGQLAVEVGCPQGARAIGMAMNRNPISIFQPCHRVVGHNGRMVGFANGIPMKEQLLRMEGALE